MKKCTKCEEIKVFDEFHKNKKNRDGLSYICKKCRAKVEKEYQKTHAEELREYGKEYRRINKERIRKVHREYERKRRKNPKYRISQSVSASIRNAIKDKKGGRSWETLVGFTLSDLIIHLEKQFTEGMVWENYGKWTIDHKIPQSVFNFTSSDHPDFKKCWSLDNLQPMWAVENIVKSNKLPHHFQPCLKLKA